MTREGLPLSVVFLPPDSRRNDVSVNWEDDNNAIHHLLEQKRDGEYIYKIGAARLPYSSIEEVSRIRLCPDSINCNREPLPDNIYHGNILYRDGLSKDARMMIAGKLALAVTDIENRK